MFLELKRRGAGKFLDYANVAGLRAFFALDDFKFNFVAFIQLGSAGVIGVNEDILATIVRSDKSKTLTCVEKLYFACLHMLLP